MNDVDHFVPLSQRRRRPRLHEGEVRERMFTAARQILYKQGLSISLEDLGMDDVVALAGVPRSAAYRVWPYKGDFVDDLLLNLAGPNWMGTAAFDTEALALSRRQLLEHWDELKEPHSRRALLEETVRLAVGQNYDAVIKSDEWHVYVALCATSRATAADNSRQRLAAELLRAEMAFLDLMHDFYMTMAVGFGLRLRPGMTFRHLAAAGAAVVEGLALREIMVTANRDNPAAEGTTTNWSLANLLDGPLPDPHDDDDAASGQWLLVARAFLGILDAFAELDPNWQPSDQLRSVIEAFEPAPASPSSTVT